MNRFRLLLPPQWVLIDVAGDYSAGVRDVVSGLSTGLAPDKAQAIRQTLTGRLESMAKDVAARGGLAIVMQAVSLDEIGVYPMLVITRMALPEGADPVDALVALVATDPSARLMDLDAAVALRTEHSETLDLDPSKVVATLPADLAALAQQAEAAGEFDQLPTRLAHRVHYVLGVPGQPQAWVDLVASVQVGDDQVGAELWEAYSTLFDDMVMSFSWAEGDDE